MKKIEIGNHSTPWNKIPFEKLLEPRRANELMWIAVEQTNRFTHLIHALFADETSSVKSEYMYEKQVLFRLTL